MRVLLSDGSGLTSRQVATRLGDLGHDVEILSSIRICLTRFTRHVRRVHLVPAFGRAPFAWFEAAAVSTCALTPEAWQQIAQAAVRACTELP